MAALKGEQSVAPKDKKTVAERGKKKAATKVE